jgi:AcrR family transcriptional regulator
VSRQDVLTAALGLVERHGLAALTMRDLAAELGVAVGTVYAAAGGKDEILQGLADTVLGDLAELEVAGLGWADALVALFSEWHRLMLAHPAIAQLSVLEPLVGPGISAGQDVIFGVIQRAGFADQDVITLFTTLSSYTAGYTLCQISRPSSPGPRDQAGQRREIQLTDEQFVSGLRALLGGFVPGR